MGQSFCARPKASTLPSSDPWHLAICQPFPNRQSVTGRKDDSQPQSIASIRKDITPAISPLSKSVPSLFFHLLPATDPDSEESQTRPSQTILDLTQGGGTYPQTIRVAAHPERLRKGWPSAVERGCEGAPHRPTAVQNPSPFFCRLSHFQFKLADWTSFTFAPDTIRFNTPIPRDSVDAQSVNPSTRDRLTSTIPSTVGWQLSHPTSDPMKLL